MISAAPASTTKASAKLAHAIQNAVVVLCDSPLVDESLGEELSATSEGDLAAVDDIIASCLRLVGSTAVSDAPAPDDDAHNGLHEVDAAVRESAGPTWKAIPSRSNGRFFYHDDATGQTTWVRPDPVTTSKVGLLLSPGRASAPPPGLGPGPAPTRPEPPGPAAALASEQYMDRIRTALSTLPRTSSDLNAASAADAQRPLDADAPGLDVAVAMGQGIAPVASAVEALANAAADPQGAFSIHQAGHAGSGSSGGGGLAGGASSSSASAAASSTVEL